MILLAFVIEFLISYLVKMFTFQIFESREFYGALVRLKRILAGNYFPLSMLPAIMVDFSMVLPFAYSFYVPAEIYLEKISILEGLQGLGIQLLWIVILYGVIKIIWRRRFSNSKS
jgi:ABC-2 type transport system permease protein